MGDDKVRFLEPVRETDIISSYLNDILIEKISARKRQTHWQMYFWILPKYVNGT